MEESDVWIRWNSAFSTHSRSPGVPEQVRSTAAAPIRTLPGPGKWPRDRHTTRRHHRGSSRSRDERGNRSALERERLERPSGPVGALTGAEDPSLAEESSSGGASTALSRNEQAVE